MYYATVELADGETQTVNGILNWSIKGDFLYLNGTDFEIFLSSHHYRFIEINEGSL